MDLIISNEKTREEEKEDEDEDEDIARVCIKKKNNGLATIKSLIEKK